MFTFVILNHLPGMRKLIILLLLFCYFKASAQTIISKAFSAGFELGIPTNSVFNIGTGASAKFELPIASPVSLSLTGGITSMFYKSNLFNSSHTPGAAVFVPLKAGVKYFFNRDVYAEGEAGTAIEANYAKQSVFAFSIGPGFIAPVGEKNSIDISFRYEDWANQLRQTAVHIAYRFGL
jgi:hypothetical protein